MKEHSKYILIILFLSTAIIFIGFIPYLTGYVTIDKFIITLFYIIVWAIVLYKSIKHNCKPFIKFSAWFWLINFFSFFLIATLGSYGVHFPLFTPVHILSLLLFWGLTYLEVIRDNFLLYDIIISVVFSLITVIKLIKIHKQY